METKPPTKLSFTEYNFSLALLYEKALMHYHKREFSTTALILQQNALFTYRTLIERLGGAMEKYDCLRQVKTYFLTFLPEFENAFPSDNEQDYDLLNQLENFKNNNGSDPKFSITENEILKLLQRVEELQDMAKDILNKSSRL